MHLRLPAQVNADGLLPFLAQLSTVGDADEVKLDFEELRRVSPGALVGLVATVTRWLRQGKRVAFQNLERCAITGYLQRMDVLKACGAELPENFRRHDARGRFVPVQLVDHDVDRMGNEMASCLAPGGEDYEHPLGALHNLAWYVFTETANNARQHSRGLGYAAAQVARSEGLVRLAVGDNGKGIRQSFGDAGLPWAAGMTDAEAILKALEPKISSRGRPTNEGVGLTLVSGLVRRTRGWLLVVSGDGVVRMGAGGPTEQIPLPGGGHYQGTLVVTAFRQQDVKDFASLLHDAKVEAGLLRRTTQSGTFMS
ncbi:MAG: hypothetical protein JNN17_15590 [Verrucomicrobiaceae bacterium]|nr:hypothetical protein [Verrucomicrobiaceae bacterium]